tara:strand:- start:68 stop:916 length:849 start_codon:yes stop_codon:yes gene_type:complete
MNKRNQRLNRKPNQKIHRQRNTNTKAKSKRETNYSESIQLVEGRHAVREAILAGTRKVREVNMSEGLDPGSVIEDITNLSKELKIPLRMHAKSKFKSITITESAQGVQAVCDPLPDLEIEDLVEGAENPFILVLDSITDPRNLGSIIRSGECAGATGILLPRHRSVRITPTVSKTAQGAIEHIPIATTSGIPKALTRLKELGVWTVGMDMTADENIYNLRVANDPLALVLGSEGKGLGRLTRERCDLTVKIPILGITESLNVGAAAAIGCFEISRQRLTKVK